MTTKKNIPLFRTILMAVALLGLAGCTLAVEDITGEIPDPTVESQQKSDIRLDEINEVLQEAITSHQDVVAFMLYEMVIDRVDFSEDGRLALVWMAMQDKENGQIIPSEPMMAIAYREYEEDGSPSSWEVVFPVDSAWNGMLNAVPESLLKKDIQQKYLDRTQAEQKNPPLQGYFLPWQAGLKKPLTGSIGHVFTYRSCPNECMYAYDFADGSMFPILATRAGRVKQAVWNWPNGDSNHTNFILLEDDTTTPVTYHIYFHLAQDSIPLQFRSVGAQVFQGQQIGLVDDTGYSTGHHLHYHIHTNESSYWGTSVDFVFKDVTVNGGRPRTCAEASAYPSYGTQCMSVYTSANSDKEPPTSAITSPRNGSQVTTSKITVEGWANDNNEVMYSQLLIGTGADWKAIGDLHKGTTHTQEIDLCQAGIPSGNFYLAIQALDQAGNLSASDKGVIYLVNDSTCGDEPAAPQLQAPAGENGAPYSPDDPVLLQWTGVAGEEFRSELTGSDGFSSAIEWQDSSSWTVGPLPTGRYTWTVWSRGPAGENSAMLNFDVVPVGQAIKTRLKELEPLYQETSIPLEWEVVNGEDQIAYFLLEVQQDDSSWEDWSEIVSSDIRSLSFEGETGSRYSFRLLAVDNQDSPEEVTPDNERSTRIAPVCDPDEYDQNSTGDNQPGTASLLPFGETQQHNLCGTNDEDWYQFSATSGSRYRIRANSGQGDTALRMELYNADGSTLVSSSQEKPGSARVEITWTVENSQSHTIRIVPVDPAELGGAAAYDISIRRTFQLSNSYLCDVTIPLLEGKFGLKLDAARARRCK